MKLQKQGRIDTGIVQAEAPVKVGACDPSCHANRRNGITALYHLPGLNMNIIQVAKHGNKPLSMINKDGLAIKEIITNSDDFPLSWIDHCLAFGCRYVHTAVRAARLTIKEST